MIFKIMIPKSLEKLVDFGKKYLKNFSKLLKCPKMAQKLRKFEFLSSKFVFSVIFRPFTQLAKFFYYFFLKLLTFVKILIPSF